uniref:Geranylgeranyl transferase type-2 subunit alpha n=1 Tax=Riptortus pedestris TaxID=329032 RepID=R4WR25_RIPPE|nr:rab geranylgeranyl transferase alpha subunit [Riptortus pedestris]
MHGQAKVKTSEEEKERKKKDREQKAKVYRDGMTKIFDKRKKCEFDDEALDLISDILITNPDIYTLWNFRKEILLTYKDKSHDDLACILSNEMRLTEMCLRANPKSYCAWYHRLWLLDNMPYSDLEKELFLCTKYLKLDERNFHCWDYRRAVVAKLEVAPSEELDYTTVKIEENFSNYSSWHYRSQLLPLVYPDPSNLRPVDEPTHLKELELVQAACFTDPSDSSSWFYLRWLLGRPSAQLSPVQAFISNKSLVCIFNQPVNKVDSPWSAFDEARYIWERPLNETEHGDELTFSIKYNGEEKSISFQKDKVWSSQPVFDPPVSSALMSVLSSTLDSSNQLLELEPDSKWTLLTSIVLMQAIDKKKYRDVILDRLSLLIKYDPYRKEYYNDLRSKFIMEEALECLVTSSEKVCLSNLSLTTLHHSHYLGFAKSVDLSKNNLRRALPMLGNLINCEVLTMDENNLASLKGFPKLPGLKRLFLRHNSLSIDNLRIYLSNNDLKEVDISGNPLTSEDVTNLSKEFNINIILNNQKN